MTPISYLIACIFILAACLLCVEKAIQVAVESDRKAIADKLRGYATAAKVERFDLLPEHFEEIADDIEGGEDR